MSEALPVFDPMIAYGSAAPHRPGRDTYLSAKALEVLPYIYGPKGEFLVEFYTYFRWLDNLVDSSLIPLDQRRELIERQKKLLFGQTIKGPLLPIEELFARLPFDRAAPGKKTEILDQFSILIGTMQEDVNHGGLWPRTSEEIRRYGTRVLMPYAQVVSLTLNDRPLTPTPAYEQFLADWSYLGALLHFCGDLDIEKNIKVGFSEDEAQSIRVLTDEESRRRKILEIYTPKRFRKEWKDTLSSFRRGIQSFYELDIPKYQQWISYYYLSIREPLRLPRLFERIEAGLSQTYVYNPGYAY